MLLIRTLYRKAAILFKNLRLYSHFHPLWYKLLSLSVLKGAAPR